MTEDQKAKEDLDKKYKINITIWNFVGCVITLTIISIISGIMYEFSLNILKNY